MEDDSMSASVMNPTSFDYIYKVLVIGSSGVGKTSFLSRYFDNAFDHRPGATVGVDFRHRNFKRDGKRMQLQIWDTAGQERYQSLTTSYFRGSMGVIVMFDLTNRDSFESCRFWINKAVESTGQKDILVLLIGNKLDLADEERVVETEEAEQLAGELDMKYFETSAKEGINVSEVIEYLLKSIPEKAAEVSNPENSLPITNRDTENGGQQCPC